MTYINIKLWNQIISDTYAIYNSTETQTYRPTIIEYIQYVNTKDTGFRVESKRLNSDTIERMSEYNHLKLVDIFPTLDHRLIATYHFSQSPYYHAKEVIKQ